MKHPLGSHILVALQLAALLGCVYPVNITNLGSVYALALCLLGAALGLAALYYNKIGTQRLPGSKGRRETDHNRPL